MSSSAYSTALPMPFSSLQYRDMSDGSDNAGSFREEAEPQPRPPAEVEMSQAELAARIRQERADAVAQAVQKLRHEYEEKSAAALAPIASALKSFAEQRDDYFARVEAEVVQLSLSIAAKILHREAQVDPMLVASLVRIAIEKMKDDSGVTIRVGAGLGNAWKQYFASSNPGRVEVIEDASLTGQDCILETALGSANFGLDTQLKEIEQGFFDLLALRPAAR